MSDERDESVTTNESNTEVPEVEKTTEENTSTQDAPADTESSSNAVQNLRRRGLLGRITGIGGAPPSNQPPSIMNIISAIINGGGIGLLLGMLMGLTDKPVVAGIITTLSGLLTLLLGVNEVYITILKGIRIGAFGVFCVAGVLWGLDIRTNNGMLPSRERMMEEYTKVGFTKQEALDFIAYREFQIIPRGWKQGALATAAETKEGDSTGDTPPGEETENSSSKPVTENSNGRVLADQNATGAERKSLLFSSEVNADACANLYQNDMTLPKSEIKNSFVLAEGTWAEMANDFDPLLPDDIYKQTLLTIRDCFCKGGMTGKVKVTKTTRKVESSESLDEIKKTFDASGGIWKTIEEKISNAIPEKYQKTIFVTTYKILSHD
ncbi:MAG TPA: hypothetical protein PL045_00605 [Chitinophagaceae bacterium]|nr:hypothetical protein [Chitinophagaceae bacterium]